MSRITIRASVVSKCDPTVVHSCVRPHQQPKRLAWHGGRRLGLACRAASDKVIYLIRHGQTEMNEYLSFHPHDAPGFVDPRKFDTVLTPKGEFQAQQINPRANLLQPKPEVLLASPLSRALLTAETAFDGIDDIPWEVAPLARERVWFASDCGSDPKVLSQNFPRWNFEDLPPIWWHNTSNDPLQVHPESPDVFMKRTDELVEWLHRRPEQTLALVCHWGVIYTLTGESFQNCEMRQMRLSQLSSRMVFTE
eukprot:CAMPEP_0198201038 /NCGR_PEP_ID=MMETSP1445-20131203/3868_1 /TAXON_ID=36898 /ORGANISM="Pyramimonas sp., Strain CCMP2087" /LENGTH=250 /DNA_ID=CAMNT_0043871219 /DNA_START=65 /DNA_END=820 /DNA_ORIENTATION=-